jgi:hypothetical protein
MEQDPLQNPRCISTTPTCPMMPALACCAVRAVPQSSRWVRRRRGAGVQLRRVCGWVQMAAFRYSDTIPGHIRRAVLLRDRKCAWSRTRLSLVGPNRSAAFGSTRPARPASSNRRLAIPSSSAVPYWDIGI